MSNRNVGGNPRRRESLRPREERASRRREGPAVSSGAESNFAVLALPTAAVPLPCKTGVTMYTPQGCDEDEILFRHKYIESSYQEGVSFCGRVHTHNNDNLNKIIT